MPELDTDKLNAIYKDKYPNFWTDLEPMLIEGCPAMEYFINRAMAIDAYAREAFLQGLQAAGVIACDNPEQQWIEQEKERHDV